MIIQRLDPFCSEIIGPYSFVNFSNALAGLCILFLVIADLCNEHLTTHYSFGISFPNNQCGGGPGGKNFCLKNVCLAHLMPKTPAANATRNRLQFDKDMSVMTREFVVLRERERLYSPTPVIQFS